MSKTNKYSPEVRERAVRLVQEARKDYPSLWTTVESIAPKIGIEPSVGSKDDNYDNALAETINGLYKAELIHRRAPRKTVESLELATLEWVTWFNHQRLLEPLGFIPSAEAEDRYYQQLPVQAEHACT